MRNSDVDYRLLEAAKAGDLDTVKVANVPFMKVLTPCCSWLDNYLLQLHKSCVQLITEQCGVGKQRFFRPLLSSAAALEQR